MIKLLNGAYAYFLGSILFFSCQGQIEDNQGKQEEQLSMSLIAHIGTMQKESAPRYSGELNSVQFAEGDEIGVFVDEKSATKWSYGVKWTSQENIYWGDLVTESTFSAYYPYNNETTEKTKVYMPSLKVQDGSLANIYKHDFLVAETTQSYGTDGIVSFTDENSFRHISCLVQFDIKATGMLTGAVLKSLSMEGTNIVSSASYSFEDEKVTFMPDESADLLDASLQDYSLDAGGEAKSYYFILNQKETDSLVSLTITYSVNGTTFVASCPSFAAGNKFQAGTLQKYNILVNGEEVQITGGTISNWSDGGKMEDVNLDIKLENEQVK